MCKMPAGTYYVGDLCYVMHNEWDEVCDLMFKDNPNGTSGRFTLTDGRIFAIYFTAIGDGCYYDQNGHLYGVDSGTIGCILMEGIEPSNFGNVVTFDEDFETSAKDGVLSFGHIRIET